MVELDRLKREVRGMRTQKYAYSIASKILWEEPSFPTPKIMMTIYALDLVKNEKIANCKSSTKFENMQDFGTFLKYCIEDYCLVRRHNELKDIKDGSVIELHREAIKTMLNSFVDSAYKYEFEPKR